MGRARAAGAPPPLSTRHPVIVARAGVVPPWAHRVDGRVVTTAVSDPETVNDAASVWIDGSMEQALDLARTVHRHDATIQVGLVAAAEDRTLLERRILFTPGLGEVWLVSPEDLDEGLLSRAAEVTRTRRSFRSNRRHLIESTTDLRGRPNRAVVTDAYLAALLQVLPDPVISVDENDAVVSWSVAAERMLDRDPRSAVGRTLSDILRVRPPEALENLLDAAREATARREISVVTSRGLLTVEAVATPVRAEGVQVRAVILRDLTEQRQTLERLQTAMAVRSRFFASMSHEIRTPINAILGYNDILLSGALGEVDPTQLAHLERSQAAARHLLELVNDVLDLSKLEAGKIELRPQEVRSGTIMTGLAATLEPLAREHGSELRQECPDPGLRLRTDPRRVNQILLNLVSNAVKFGQGRPVSLRCMPDGEDGVCFEVEDEGRGIAPEDQERIFEEFEQAGSEEGGTGLGLSISRRLAGLLGGSLELESELGRGSIFRLRLPRDCPVEPEKE